MTPTATGKREREGEREGERKEIVDKNKMAVCLTSSHIIIRWSRGTPPTAATGTGTITSWNIRTEGGREELTTNRRRERRGRRGRREKRGGGGEEEERERNI